MPSVHLPLISSHTRKQVFRVKIIKKEFKQCFSCMEEHEVEIVEIEETATFKGLKVAFNAVYEHCSNADEYSETEEMMKRNSLAQKDAYRIQAGFLTSYEIKAIRDKYGISQKELSEVLDWGPATITRYENHQVQNRAHDYILRQIDSDPALFLKMLERSKDKAMPKYMQYYKRAYELVQENAARYICNFVSPNYSFDSVNGLNEEGFYFDPCYCKEKSENMPYSFDSGMIHIEMSAAA